MLVSLCGGAFANAVVDGSDGAQGESTEVSRQAPEWPFRGMVQYWANKNSGHNVLRCWSTEIGEINEVRLGPLSWCNEYPMSRRDAVILGHIINLQ